MADIRATPAEVLAALDNVAKEYQVLAAITDGGFAGESTNTVLYGLRALATRVIGWGSADAIAKVYPNAQAALAYFDSQFRTSPAATRILAPLVRGIIAGVCDHEANFDSDYSAFWAWFAATKAASPNDKVLGEVADLMLAAGIAVDPNYCVPPEHLILGHILFTGTAAATLTMYNTVDPQLYKGHTTELYCIARKGSPDHITGFLPACKIETDTALTDGATAFALAIEDTLTAGQVVDIASTDAHQICGVTAQDLTAAAGHGTLSGGGVSTTADEFYIRVKRYRAAAI